MFEVNEENYLEFLSYHGRSCDCCRNVVEKWEDTEEYHTMLQIKTWVDACKIFLKMEDCDADYC